MNCGSHKAGAGLWKVTGNSWRVAASYASLFVSEKFSVTIASTDDAWHEGKWREIWVLESVCDANDMWWEIYVMKTLRDGEIYMKVMLHDGRYALREKYVKEIIRVGKYTLQKKYMTENIRDGKDTWWEIYVAEKIRDGKDTWRER